MLVAQVVPGVATRQRVMPNRLNSGYSENGHRSRNGSLPAQKAMESAPTNAVMVKPYKGGVLYAQNTLPHTQVGPTFYSGKVVHVKADGEVTILWERHCARVTRVEIARDRLVIHVMFSDRDHRRKDWPQTILLHQI